MSLEYPLWCVVCKDDGFVGTRWESPGTAADYVDYCPSCGRSHVMTQKVETKKQHEAIKKGEIDYKDIGKKNTFDRYDL